MERRTRIILLLLICFTAVIHFYFVNAQQESVRRVPYTAPGSFTCFHAEMASELVIADIDVTDEYLFFTYATYDVVAAYDWNGEYQFSLAFCRENNGAMGVRCEDGLLYVSDNDDNEFVFSGKELLWMNESSTSEHTVRWFSAKQELPIQIRNGNIYDEAGGYIMPLPGII